MASGIDFSSLSRAERRVLTTGILLFANGIIPWWYRLKIDEDTFTYNAGLAGLGLVACGCGGLAAIAVVLRANIWPNPAPAKDGTVYTGLGLVATTALVVELLSESARWLGLYVALTLAVVLAASGWLRRAERARGWT